MFWDGKLDVFPSWCDQASPGGNNIWMKNNQILFFLQILLSIKHLICYYLQIHKCFFKSYLISFTYEIRLRGNLGFGTSSIGDMGQQRNILYCCTHFYIPILGAWWKFDPYSFSEMKLHEPKPSGLMANPAFANVVIKWILANWTQNRGPHTEYVFKLLELGEEFPVQPG